MIKAILFDMDDLMINSAPLHIEASRRVFKPFGIDITTMSDEAVTSYFGKRVIDILKITADYYNLDKNVDIEKLAKEREEIFLEMIKKELEPMPGLFTLLERVKGMGVKKAIASSGTKKYINVVLEKFELTDFFEVVVSGDMVKNGKPAPDVFLKAAKELNLKPEECVVIEDATAGVEAAKKAGAFCIAVDNPLSQYKQDLTQADQIVERLDKIDEEMIMSIDKKR